MEKTESAPDYRFCPVCDTRGVDFLPLSPCFAENARKYGFAWFGKGEMTSLDSYFCSHCGASDQERLYAFWLREEAKKGGLAQVRSAVHFAPEPALSGFIRASKLFPDYQTADLTMAGVDHRADLMQLPFGDGVFDFFLCSHILEHVPDDRRAIRELFRILRPGRRGILMAPVAVGLPHTLEDASAASEEERWHLFGQQDHVRLYAHDDYVARIKEAGFLVSQLGQETFSARTFARLGLKPTSILYIVARPGEQPGAAAPGAEACKKSKAPRVSVILTSRNHGAFLRESIDSVLRQTCSDFELIIWDDASSDASWEIIQSYQDPRIKAFRNERQRRGIYGINKALTEKAAGEYIAIHHSDDVWEPEKLERQINILEKRSDLGAVFTNALAIDEKGQVLAEEAHIYCRIFNQPNRSRHQWLRYFLQYGNALCHPSVLIRKSCYQDCGLYRYGLGQLPDLDMWVRLAMRYELHVMPEKLIRFRVRDKEANSSGIRPDTIARHGFDLYSVLDTYRKIASFDELARIFPEMAAYDRGEQTDLLFVFAVAVLLSVGNQPVWLFALHLLFEALNDERRRNKLEEHYGFEYNAFCSLTGIYDIFSHQPLDPQGVKVLNAVAWRDTERIFTAGMKAFQAHDEENALAAFSGLLDKEPENPLPLAYLAFLCARENRAGEAAAYIERAAGLAPERADFKAALGETFLKYKQLEQAEHYLREALGMQPDLWTAYPALAQTLHLTRRDEEAVALLRVAAGMPSQVQDLIRGLLAEILLQRGDIAEAAQTFLRFSRGIHDDLSAVRLLARSEASGEQCIDALGRIQLQLAESGVRMDGSDEEAAVFPAKAGPLRIAFVVSDAAREEELGRLPALLRFLPPEEFMTFLILNDAQSAQNDCVNICALLADQVIVIDEDDDDAALAKIHAGIPDILLDLDAYGPAERLAVFLRAKAPGNLLWGEAPLPPLSPDCQTLTGARLGADAMFPCMVLPEMGECYDLPELPLLGPGIRTDTAMGPFVFGCLTPAMRVGREAWDLFAEVLKARPDSVLLINLEDADEAARAFIVSCFAQAGVAAERLRFVHARTAEDLCCLWQEVSLGLAPATGVGGLALPACLWMGRPYLSLASFLPWSRRPSALLETLGLEAWIAETPEAYIALSQHIPPMPDPAIRARMKALRLNDPAAFARDFAAAIKGMAGGVFPSA